MTTLIFLAIIGLIFTVILFTSRSGKQISTNSHNEQPLSDEINLNELVRQYQGNCLSNLIKKHLKTLDESTLLSAIRETFKNFPKELQEPLNAFTQEYPKAWLINDELNSDLGNLFTKTINDTRQMTIQKGFKFHDDRLFDIFNIMVMKLAHFAHSNSSFLAKLNITSNDLQSDPAKAASLEKIGQHFKEAQIELMKIIIRNLSHPDLKERNNIALFLRTEVLPAIETDPDPNRRSMSVKTVLTLINEMRPPEGDLELTNLDNAIFHHLMIKMGLAS